MMEPAKIFSGRPLEDLIAIAWLYARAARARMEAGDYSGAKAPLVAAQAVIEHATARITRALNAYGVEFAARAGRILSEIGNIERYVFTLDLEREVRALTG